MGGSRWWTYRYAGTSSNAKVHLRQIIGEQQMFTTPKPVELVRRILELATDKDSLILDSFAGSGVTGHAVLEANNSDGEQRKFILVELEKEICSSVTANRLSLKWSNGNGHLEKSDRYLSTLIPCRTSVWP